MCLAQIYTLIARMVNRVLMHVMQVVAPCFEISSGFACTAYTFGRQHVVFYFSLAAPRGMQFRGLIFHLKVLMSQWHVLPILFCLWSVTLSSTSLCCAFFLWFADVDFNSGHLDDYQVIAIENHSLKLSYLHVSKVRLHSIVHICKQAKYEFLPNSYC